MTETGINISSVREAGRVSEISVARLRALRAGLTTGRCVIVGNGPSLNRTNLELLRGEDIFVSNFAFYNDFLKRSAKYYVVADPVVMHSAWREINAFTGVNRFFTRTGMERVVFDDSTIVLRRGGPGMFSTDAEWFVVAGHTVSFIMMQLAYYMGYGKALLVGFDHHYAALAHTTQGGLIMQGERDDVNHFSPDYLRGKVGQAADVDGMTRDFECAKSAFERAGGEIVNCTAGGKLEVFRRGVLEEELDSAPPPARALRAAVREAMQKPSARERDSARLIGVKREKEPAMSFYDTAVWAWRRSWTPDFVGWIMRRVAAGVALLAVALVLALLVGGAWGWGLAVAGFLVSGALLGHAGTRFLAEAKLYVTEHMTRIERLDEALAGADQLRREMKALEARMAALDGGGKRDGEAGAGAP